MKHWVLIPMTYGSFFSHQKKNLKFIDFSFYVNVLFWTILDLYARNHDYTRISKPSLTLLILLLTLPSWLSPFCSPFLCAYRSCAGSLFVFERGSSFPVPDSYSLSTLCPTMLLGLDHGNKDVLFRAEQSMVTYSQHLDLLHVPALTLFHCKRWFNCTSNLPKLQ